MQAALPYPNERIALVAITRHGIALAGRIALALPGARLFAPERFRADAAAAVPGAVCYQGRTGDQIAGLFAGFDAVVGLLSLGALVRLVAPHLEDKTRDPAVVVMDEAGRFAIPVLSGHRGGANALARRLAEALGATAVLTTASDARETLAVDLLGRELGWTIEARHDELVRASAAVVNDEPVALVHEAGDADWWTGHAGGRTAPLPANVRCYRRIEEIDPAAFSAVLWVSRRSVPPALAAALDGKRVIYRPALQPHRAAAPVAVALGLGCDRGTSEATIARAVDEALAAAGLEPAQVAVAASVDLKADEPGLLGYSARQGWPLVFYSPEQLAAVPVPHPSETVRRHTGTPSVSEAAALLAAAADATGLLIEKHRLRDAGGRNVTVSIARISP